jgi:group II intron reverse transcriptase/maturase
LLRLQREIYERTRSASWPVPDLMTWVLDPRNLAGAWDRVQSNDGSKTPGLDGATAAGIRPRVQSWLGQLSTDLTRGAYRPTPPRWIDVPKDPGGSKMRRLGILTIRDRVVHAAVKQVLEPILEPVFSPDSFGFRPGRSVPGALDQVTGQLAADGPESLPFHYAWRTDVRNCFDTIDHPVLADRLSKCTSDEKALELIGRLAQAGGVCRGWLWFRRWAGLVQGSALSPLLCNYYLDPLDQALAELGRRTGGGVRAFRYADDLLVVARNRLVAARAQACARQALRGLRQELSESKSLLGRVVQGVDWLGVRIEPQPNRWTGRLEFVYVVPDAKVFKMLERIDEMTVPPSARLDAGVFDLGRWLASLNEQLRDWWQAYMYADNAESVFRTLDERTHDRVGELLHHVTGKRRGVLLREHSARLPRGFTSWEAGGVQLTVLSSLAPRRPRCLIGRPPWMWSAGNGKPSPRNRPAGGRQAG